MSTSTNSSHKIYITIHGQADGIGSQVMSKISGLAYCKKYGYTYTHTPFLTVGHISRSVALEFDKFLNLGQYEIQRGEPKNVQFIRISNPKENENVLNTIKPQDNDVLLETWFFHNQIEKESPSEFYTPEFRDLIRQKYHNTPKPELHFDENKYHIAVHIRRGDVNPRIYPNRWVTNQQVRTIMDKIALQHKSTSKKIQFHIYSQGNPSQFKEITDNNPDEVVFHLNENIQRSFHGMAMSDELVMCKSGFSYAPALYHTGIVHYIPFWHKPLDHWIVEEIEELN